VRLTGIVVAASRSADERILLGVGSNPNNDEGNREEHDYQHEPPRGITRSPAMEKMMVAVHKLMMTGGVTPASGTLPENRPGRRQPRDGRWSRQVCSANVDESVHLRLNSCYIFLRYGTAEAAYSPMRGATYFAYFKVMNNLSDAEEIIGGCRATSWVGRRLSFRGDHLPT
jgi:hypothetical protein